MRIRCIQYFRLTRVLEQDIVRYIGLSRECSAKLPTCIYLESPASEYRPIQSVVKQVKASIQLAMHTIHPPVNLHEDFVTCLIDGDRSLRLPRKLIAQVTDQVPIERQPTHASVHRSAEPVGGQPANQVGHRQERDALDEVKLWDVLLEIVWIVNSSEELDFRAARHRWPALLHEPHEKDRGLVGYQSLPLVQR
jgi:hypothetical protein